MSGGMYKNNSVLINNRLNRIALHSYLIDISYLVNHPLNGVGRALYFGSMDRIAFYVW